MDNTDRRTLQEAKALLENPGLAARLVNVVGRPIEEGLKYLPARVRDEISAVTRKALLGSLKVALSTVNDAPGWQSSRLTNKIGVAAAGGVGGFFGMPGLARLDDDHDAGDRDDCPRKRRGHGIARNGHGVSGGLRPRWQERIG